MAHVSEQKTRVVKDIKALLTEYPIIGALNMEGLPARQLQVMREKLRDTCVIKMTKRRLMKVALQDSKEGIDQLEAHLKGMPALLFTKTNPFALFKTLKKSKSPAPAKAGQEAPKDIKIPAGPTPFAPGPIIGELGKFGLKTGVENGKVAVKEEKVVCKEGETINRELAGLLTRMQIFPMEVGLDLTAVYEDGEIIPKSVLDIDEEQYIADVMSAAAGAFNLGMHASIYNDVTTPALITKAAQETMNLAVEAGILNEETAPRIIAQAQAHASAIASHLPEELRPAGLATAPVAEESVADTPDEKPDDEPEEEQESAAAAGMGALFG